MSQQICYVYVSYLIPNVHEHCKWAQKLKIYMLSVNCHDTVTMLNIYD